MVVNQSRTQTNPADEESLPARYESFVHQPLDPDVDCIRLIRILPAEDTGGVLACTIFHIAFAYRPYYEALSYMWGDTESDQQTILVDGKKFSIGKNLWDALHYLRDIRNKNIPLWIDALSINQADIPERTRQVRITRWIYSRACTVVVWLGEKHLKYQDGVQLAPSDVYFTSQEGKTNATQSAGSTETAQYRNEQVMAEELYIDEYWDRLWIVQELSQGYGTRACRIQVCFGRLVMGWERFIHFITLHGCGEGGPLRLDRQLKEQYKGGLKLKQLLKEHKAAKCRDPRDKIYGLVGLAADARSFPMDYSKTSHEVWVDTMNFMNQRGSLEEDEIIETGCLVKSLLMDADCTLLGQSPGFLKPGASPEVLVLREFQTRHPEAFCLRGYILGIVRYVGPSTSELVGDISKVNEWEGQLEQNFGLKNELGEAHRDSNMLLEDVLYSSPSEMSKMCLNHISTVCWQVPLGKSVQGSNYHRAYLHFDNPRRITLTKPSVEVSQDTALDLAQRQNLEGPTSFQITELSELSTPWRMGVSARLIQHGDLICCVPGIAGSIVVRVHQINSVTAKMQVFGTGIVVDHVAKYKWDDRNRTDREMQHEGMPIMVDAETLFVLLP